MHGGQKSIDVSASGGPLTRGVSVLLFYSKEKHFRVDEADPEPFVQIVIDLD